VPMMIVGMVVIAIGAAIAVLMQLTALSQRFLLQTGDAVALKVGLPGGKLLLGQQITRAYIAGAQDSVADGADDRDFLPGGPPHCSSRWQLHNAFRRR